MPDAVLADQLFGSVDGVTAAAAALAGGRLGAGVGPGLAVDQGRRAVGGDEGWGVAVAEALGPEEPSVAGTAVDLLVGAVASQSRVQRTVAFGTVEALLVPHLQARVGLIRRQRKQSEKLTVPLASCCSAANTAPPHRGQPWPGAALMAVVSGL